MATPAGVVGFVGLDDTSLELAASLVRAGYAVKAFDSQVHNDNVWLYLSLSFTK